MALFPEPTRRIGGGPPDVQRRFDLAFTEPIKVELLAVATANPERWLGWHDFAQVRDKHKIGFCMGHVLSSLVRAGRLQAMICWHGAERPGQETEYRGYNSRWRAIHA